MTFYFIYIHINKFYCFVLFIYFFFTLILQKNFYTDEDLQVNTVTSNF